MARMKDLYQMLQTGEYYDYKEAYEFAEAEGVKKYMYKGNILITEEVKHKVNFVEMYLKGLRNDNIRNNNSIDKYLIQGGNNR